MRTVGRILEDVAPKDPDARRDARLLLAHVLGVRSAISVDRAGALSPEQQSTFDRLWSRRSLGEPVQYLLGEWDFCGRTFRVDSRALIPRAETEHVVEEALREAPAAGRVVDLGCGSGILAITLALERKAVSVLATDVSPAALALARENAKLHEVLPRVRFVADDWLRGIAGGQFDLAVSNPPYVSRREIDSLPETVRNFEPHPALFAGEDGLSEIRRLLEGLPAVLPPGGVFVFEFGYGQSGALESEIARRKVWELRRLVADLAGIPRVAVLRRRESPR